MAFIFSRAGRRIESHRLRCSGFLRKQARNETPKDAVFFQPISLPANEAFAQPVKLEDQAGFTAPIEPPPDIEENPPPQRPAAEQFAWVPGYWAWDSDRIGYIWVSGCWRAVPPDMYWVPGYWAQAEVGWQWVAGFWAPVSNRELEYLPAPPALTDVEPPGPALSADMMRVPPCWYWYHGQYIHRAGYWIVAQPDWVWVPSHYVWTPRGYSETQRNAQEMGEKATELNKEIMVLREKIPAKASPGCRW